MIESEPCQCGHSDDEHVDLAPRLCVGRVPPGEGWNDSTLCACLKFRPGKLVPDTKWDDIRSQLQRLAQG